MNLVRSIGVIVALLALSALPALAQPQAVSAGVEVGVNESRISPDLSGQSISRDPGVFIGGYVLIHAQARPSDGLPRQCSSSSS